MVEHPKTTEATSITSPTPCICLKHAKGSKGVCVVARCPYSLKPGGANQRTRLQGCSPHLKPQGTKGATQHRGCVAGLTDSVDRIYTALLTLYDSTWHCERPSGSPHRHCSSLCLEATDEVKEAWRRLPCPPRILRPTRSDVSQPEYHHHHPLLQAPEHFPVEQYQRTKVGLQKSLMRVGRRSGPERSFSC